MNLIWVNHSYFVLVHAHGRVIGNMKKIVKAMLALGVPMFELETAFEDMDKHDHNFIHFGLINKTLIYTDYKAEYDTIKAAA